MPPPSTEREAITELLRDHARIRAPGINLLHDDRRTLMKALGLQTP